MLAVETNLARIVRLFSFDLSKVMDSIYFILNYILKRAIIATVGRQRVQQNN